MNITPLYPGGKIKALTFSYDDGVRFDGTLIEIFNRYGMKGTFNLNAGSLDAQRKFHADELKEIYAGHEIASHGFEHPFLERIPRACVNACIFSAVIFGSLVGTSSPFNFTMNFLSAKSKYFDFITNSS